MSSLPFPCLPRRVIRSCSYSVCSPPALPHTGAGPRMLEREAHVMPALLCPPQGRDASADTKTAARPPRSGLAAQHASSSCCGQRRSKQSHQCHQRRERATLVVAASRSGSVGEERGKRVSAPQCPLCALCADGGHPLLSPLPQRKSHDKGVRYFCVKHFQASDAPGAMPVAA